LLMIFMLKNVNFFDILTKNVKYFKIQKREDQHSNLHFFCISIQKRIITYHSNN
jgi:hypothetical protein